MRTQSLRTIGCLAAIALVASACGGGSTAEPPAKAGAAAPSASSAKAHETAPASDGGAVSEPAPTEKKADGLPPGKEGPKPSRPPQDVLTQKDTLFMLSFDESDAGKAADASCNKAGGKDPKKVAACMVKERVQIEADGHGFKKDKEGKLTWVVVHRQGNILLTIHKMRMTFANETENTIAVKPEGKDTGKKPAKGGLGDFTVEVPSDYRIVISDPRFGKLVYEAKIGLVPDNLL